MIGTISCRVSGIPVAHHKAFEAEFFLQDLVHGMVVLARIGAIETVV